MVCGAAFGRFGELCAGMAHHDVQRDDMPRMHDISPPECAAVCLNLGAVGMRVVRIVFVRFLGETARHYKWSVKQRGELLHNMRNINTTNGSLEASAEK